MPKASVIIPTYNRVATLSRAIDSILNQTTQDIEVIIVDDGSTDSTPKLLKDYAHRDKRVKVITQQNKGPSIARNKGVINAQSKYIAFMDSDDACAINRLELQLDFVLANPEYSACGLANLSFIDDYYPGITATVNRGYRRYCGSPFQNKKKMTVLGAHSLMTRDSFTKVGGYRAQNTIIEDLDFTLRYSHYYTWAIINDGSSYFYDHPTKSSIKGQVNNDVINHIKRIIASYISEWYRFNKMKDPVTEGRSLNEIISMVDSISSRDRAIIYRNIRYFRYTLSVAKSMNNSQSKRHIMNIISDNFLERCMINFWSKLLG